MAKDKGEYRGIFVALPDSPEFQQLSADARAVFYPLKLKLGKAGIDVFYPEILPRLTGLPPERCEAALEELKRSPSGGASGGVSNAWLVVEGNVFWLRNGLRFDPADPLASPNGRKGIQTHLYTLPKLRIVNAFAQYYDLDAPYPELNPFEAPSKPLRSTEDGRRKTETEEGSPSVAAATKRESDADLDAGFQEAWDLYPARPNNPPRKALRAWRARRRDGVAAAELIEGVRRYRKYCDATEKTGSEFVKQGATFFGPDGHWRENFEIPSGPARASPTGKHRTTAPQTYRPTESEEEIVWQN